MNAHVAADLTPRELLRAGRWNPLFARVLRVDQLGDWASVLVDADGHEVETEIWQRTPDGWTCGASSGGPREGCGTATLWIEGLQCTAGYSPGRKQVTVAYDDSLHEIPVDENGLWVVVLRTDAPVLVEVA